MARKKILVVDDDAEDRFIIQDGFMEVGATEIVQYEEDGEKALLYLEKCISNKEQLPYLIILDLNMPRLNGTQTLKAIKNDRRFSNIHVLIYSTSLNRIEKEECMNLGAEEYIIKPLTFTESLQKAQYFKDLCEKLQSEE